jgi:hypothetical protein
MAKKTGKKKIRKNLRISEEISKCADKIAKKSKSSFTKVVETLITKACCD